MNNPTPDFFSEVAAQSRAFVRSLDLPATPPDQLDRILGPLIAKLEAHRVRLGQQIDALAMPIEFSTRENRGSTGLNTIGMLADRCTILLMKEWCLEFRGKKDPSAAEALRQKQTADIVAALNVAVPGSASTHAKITNLKGGARAVSWGEAFAGLFASNILLWESQEVLYVRDIGTLPPEELRAYIQWFARGNMMRNEYIQLVETLFWIRAKGSGAS